MSNLSDPGNGVVAITPDNSVNIVPPQSAASGVRSFYCNGAGNITFVGADGSVGVVAALAGYVYPIRILRVNSTGTTATGIYGIV